MDLSNTQKGKQSALRTLKNIKLIQKVSDILLLFNPLVFPPSRPKAENVFWEKNNYYTNSKNKIFEEKLGESSI